LSESFEPSPKEFARKIGSLHDLTQVPLRRLIHCLRALLEGDEAYWTMSTLKIACLEANLQLPWTEKSVSKMYDYFLFLDETYCYSY